MDVFNVPNTNIYNWVFLPSGGSNAWLIWEKPKNCKFVNIITIGGGGGGAGGASGGTGTTRIGGGGGGSSGVTKVFIHADVLPDILYVQAGPGGAGGAAGANGTAGSLSYVSIEANTTVTNVVCRSGNAGASFGTTAGAGGAASTIVTQANMWISYLGFFQAVVGQIGSAGGSGLAGTSTTIAGVTSGGAGGGGATSVSDFAGGNITGLGSVPTISGAAAGSTSPGDPGFQPVIPNFNSSLSNTLFFTGGAGGAGSSAGTGTAGGPGAFGSGGGGGGAGITGLSGAGGRGGDGIVIITTW